VTTPAGELTREQVRAALARVRDRACEHLRGRSVDDVLAVIDRVVANWLRPDYHLRRQAEQELPALTGFSPQMIRHGLPRLLAPLRATAVRMLLDAELGDHRVLDALHGAQRARGPGLILHVLSGNIPGLAAAPILLSLALKSAVAVKCAAGDPLFPCLFAASIAEVDAQLGQCVLAARWKGGDGAIEPEAFEAADLVVASGSDTAVAAIAARVSGRFIGYGHKISFAIIAHECLTGRRQAHDLAERLAYDVSLWDQQGCLSPQLCYIEADGGMTPMEFAQLLAERLSRSAHELPPRTLTFEEKADVLRFRQDAEWRQDGGALLTSANGTDWSVSIEPNAEFAPSALNRCIRLKVIGNLSELGGALVGHRRHLEAAGIAVGAARVAELVEGLAACGVHRICPIGMMQQPPLSWRQGGRPRVADWVEWTGADEGVGA
jgi:acyl-CoA reductase LuxC